MKLAQREGCRRHRRLDVTEDVQAEGSNGREEVDAKVFGQQEGCSNQAEAFETYFG